MTDRSRLTNGTSLLPFADGRSIWARRFKDLIEDHCCDLGGPENMTHAERSLVRRCACLTVELELLENKFAEAGGASPTKLQQYQRVTNTLRRTLEALGIQQRRSRDITPTLEQYAQERETAA